MYNQRMLAKLPRPVVFGHRGASAHAPENPLAAFVLAAAQGADAVELDAKLTADGHIVVFHDPRLERTTDGRGLLAEKTLDELRRLDAGSHFSANYRGERIPLLEEVFDAVGQRLLINVELANYTTPMDGLAGRVCELVKKCKLQERVLFSSFLPINLATAKRMLPEVPRALLAQKRWKGAWARSFGFVFGDYAALHPNVADVDARQVQRVHRIKRRIHVWTLTDPEDIIRLKAWGADGVFTPDPAMALKALGRAA